MNKTEAKAICALLSAGFPKDPMPDSTVALWASKLTAFDYYDAEEAARDVVEVFERMPSLKAFEDAIRETKRARHRADVIPLAPFAGRPYLLTEHLLTHPEDRARAEALPRDSLMGFTLAEIVRQEQT